MTFFSITYLFIKNNTSQYNEVVCWNIFGSESTKITRPNIIWSNPFASEALEYCYTITNTLIISILPNIRIYKNNTS